jgi:hypothetical protein
MKNQTTTDYTSYITVQDLLYPEYLQVSAPPQEYEDNISHGTPTVVVAIDEPDNVVVNRWDIVWAEATLLSDTNDPPNTTGDSNVELMVHPNNNSNIHVTSEVPELLPPTETVAVTSITVTTNDTPKRHTTDAPFYHGNLIEDIFGLSFTIAAVAGTLAFEISTMVVYIIATVLYATAMKFLQNRSVVLGFALHICAIVFIIVSYSLLLVDAALFISSIIVTEALAISVGMINTLFSYGQRGMIWHQYVRKICHLFRWAFRDIYPSSEKEPKRTFPQCRRKGSEGDDRQNDQMITKHFSSE